MSFIERGGGEGGREYQSLQCIGLCMTIADGTVQLISCAFEYFHLCVLEIYGLYGA